MHVFKSFGGEDGFLTLPKNVKVQKTRLSQLTEYVNWALDQDNFERDVSKLRVEFTVEKRECPFRTRVSIFYTGHDYRDKFERRVFSRQE